MTAIENPLIADKNILKSFLDRAASRGVLAIDTEFVWTRTYYPALGLIQAAISAEDIILIDTLALDDLSDIGVVLGNPEVTKVLHDASGDLPILYRACGNHPPRNVFDTRMAAGFCGMTSTLSLCNLLQGLLGIELPKTESRTDWLQRPLSPDQVDYAIDDVRHLPEAQRLLCQAADRMGTGSWLMEELRCYEQPEAWMENDIREAYLRVKGSGRLSPRERAVLRELTAWRDETARGMDMTRRHVCTDGILLHLARTAPTTPEQLARTKSLSRKQVARFGGDILAAVDRALALPDTECPRLEKLNSVNHKWLKEQTDIILNRVREISEAHGIDPVLAATRRDASGLVLAARDRRWEKHRLMQGWRGELLYHPLAQHLNALPTEPVLHGSSH